jgi:DNA polymerase-3 subunit gamma/tau
VIEIDAASHGQVDDARDLRDKVYYVPVSSRYKIYIIDEAHMVTTQGFNALLKVVEEPPPHVKFIFATTEPEKVIDTIRSRTHHYPFRLVPPKVMQAYLEQICAEEGVMVEQGVLPLVVRAGAGSVRDSLSVLDQLLGAAGSGGVTYQHAAALLGYTPDWLLDELVDAFGDASGEGVFTAIDKVIEVGLDPRRFTEDLLQRLRDLIIMARVPDAVKTGLLDLPEDQAVKYAEQATKLGPGELTRAAEVVADALTAMRGTTTPRLHLELLCSRVLLPSADSGPRSMLARVERLEKAMASGGSVRPEAAALATVTAPVAGQRPAAQPSAQQPPPGQAPPAQQRPPATQPPPVQQRPTTQAPVSRFAPETQPPPTQAPPQQRPTATEPPPVQVSAPASPATAAPNTPAPSVATPAATTGDPTELWSKLLGSLAEKKVFRALLSQFQPVTIAGDALVIEAQPALVQSQGQRATEVANQMLPQLSGGVVSQVRVVATGMGGPRSAPVAPGPVPGAAPVGDSSSVAPAAPTPGFVPAPPPGDARAGFVATPVPGDASVTAAHAPVPAPATVPQGASVPTSTPVPTPVPASHPVVPTSPPQLRPASPQTQVAATPPPAASDPDLDANFEASDDDVEVGSDDAVGLLAEAFGAEVITEEGL